MSVTRLLFLQNRRFSEFCFLLVGKRQSILVEPARDDDRRHTDAVYPTCSAVWTGAGPAIGLANRFIIGWHLNGWIDKSVKMQAIESFFICVERNSLRSPES